MLKNYFHKHFLKDETELFKPKKSGTKYIKILIVVFSG